VDGCLTSAVIATELMSEQQLPGLALIQVSFSGKLPSQQQPFHTTAQRECGGCKAVKPGSEFDVPVTRAGLI
jgi:hypothetical protein